MNSDFNFLIFREEHRSVSGHGLVRDLESSIRRARDFEGWLEALLRAGELECGLADFPDYDATTIADVTDSLASSLLENDSIPDPGVLQHLPSDVPEALRISRPEGFAYYALHPLAYAESVEKLIPLRDALVIGIRSIGTTLSAVVAAELRKHGVRVRRFTVRPQGNPYDRETVLSLDQRAAVFEHLLAGSTFVIVDEGPGLSGSSMLSVAEALLDEGTRAEQIVLMPGHSPDVAQLRAENAPARWERFRCIPAGPQRRTPETAHAWMGAGAWRKKFLSKTQEWPAAWGAMERPKYLSGDGRVLWKFEGFGHYGTEPLARAQALASAHFSPAITGFENGYIGYQVIRGQSHRRDGLNNRLLRHAAEYCAYRVEAFEADVTGEENEQLSTMLRVNWEREFGTELAAEELDLPVTKACIVDGRMQPHKWIATADSDLIKIDAVSHGNDHFFPGPCDIAWDLAGAMIEWDMDSDARQFLLQAYRLLTDDDAAGRIRNYLRAYATFRMAWSRMAAAAVRGTPDEDRLLRDYQYYRQRALALAPSEREFQIRNLVA